MIIFGSVRFLYKKNKQIKKKIKKIETSSNRWISVRFGFLDKNRFKLVWLGFSVLIDLAWFFSIWLGFFGFGSVFFGLGSVWFFRFQAYRNWTGRFFKILIGLICCFSRFGFFSYFFSGFLGLIGFQFFYSYCT
jgi:hypothetical protein